jgi:hypothetical protein
MSLSLRGREQIKAEETSLCKALLSINPLAQLIPLKDWLTPIFRFTHHNQANWNKKEHLRIINHANQNKKDHLLIINHAN